MPKNRIATRRDQISLAAFAALTGGCLACTTPAYAASYRSTFEGDSVENYTPLGGKNSEGSKLEITEEKAYSGKQSLKLSYKSSGHIEFSSRKVQKLDFVGDKLYVAMWVYGSGKRDFQSASLRLLDKNNETFQFTIPGFAEALAGEGWREVRAELDLTKITSHWGSNTDGKLDRPFAFQGLAAGRSSNTEASGVVYIDNIQISDSPIVDAAEIALNPVFTPVTGPADSFLKWVSAPGKSVEFQAKVTLPSSENAHIWSWKVRDAFDKVIAEGKEPLAIGLRNKDFKFRVDNPPKGMLYVTATILNAREQVIAEAQTRAAVFTPRGKAVPLEPFIWGVAAHVTREKAVNAPHEIALMRLLGFSAARSDMTWNSIQPEPTVWNWESHDKVYANFKREGILPMPLFSFGTKWASTGDVNSKNWKDWHFAPPRVEPFVNYAKEAVKRYGHQTRYWEIWNEPDIDFWLGTVEQYTELVDAVVPAVKAVKPDILLMNGGFSESKRRPTFIPDYLRLVKNSPDIFAVHTHGAFENMLRAEETLNKQLADAGLTGNKRPPVFLNEAGFSNIRTTESEQAIQLVKKMAYAPAAGFSNYIWYDLRDDGTDPNEIEHNFGLVKRDFSPKASAIAAGTLLDTIGSRKYSHRLKLDNNGYGLVYRGNGQTVLTAWHQPLTKGDTIRPLILRAKSTAAALKIERRDIFGNSTPVVAQDGLFLLPLSNTPQYFVVSDESVQFELAGQTGMLLDYSPAVVVEPGEALAWKVNVTNPFNSPLTGRLTVGNNAPIAVNVAPKSTTPYSVTVQPKAESGARQLLPLQLESPQLPVPIKGTTEVQTAYVIPSAPNKMSVALSRRNIVSVFEATPMQELHFKDDNDLSATIEAQNTVEGIKMRVTAKDQTHFIDANPATWWRGDSIQWAIGMPNGQMFEWMGTLLPEGAKMVLSLSPDGQTGGEMPVNIQRVGNQTIYEWVLPMTLPNGSPLPSRFNFNFIINDNDGQGRKGWVEWTPGIGMEKNPAPYVPMVVQK